MIKRKAFNINPNCFMAHVGCNGKDWNFDEDGELVTVCCGVSCEVESDICNNCGEHSELMTIEDYEK